MKHYIALILMILCMASCTQHSKHWETLVQMESLIEARPDSVLPILQEMDKEELSGKEEKAKHALLLSMAMDKNYIDRTDFDVLQPAIDYYEDKGSPTDRMRTKFYQGRIHQNAGNNTPAMSCFMEAVEEGEDSEDFRTKANAYYALARIYYDLYTFDKSCEALLQAAELYDEIGKPNNAFDCWATALNGYTLAKKYDEVEKVVAECEKRLPSIGIRQKAYYYLACLNYLPKVEPVPIDEIKRTIDKYTSLVPEEQWNYMTLAFAYIEIEEYDKALTLINKWEVKEDDMVNMNKYHIFLYEIYNHKGNHQKLY